MQATLIEQGLNLMLFGMGTVFVFLTILVFSTLLMSRLVSRFANVEPEPSKQTFSSEDPSPQVLEAIRLAIAKHRQT
jgi:oxaloacetate decarboxylase gamma subunit